MIKKSLYLWKNLLKSDVIKYVNIHNNDLVIKEINELLTTIEEKRIIKNL